MNIDKEYTDLKQLLINKEKEREESDHKELITKNRIKSKSISRVSNMNSIESDQAYQKHVSPSVNRKVAGLLDNSNIAKNKDGVLYSIKGQHRYKYGALIKDSGLSSKQGYKHGINSSQKGLDPNSKILNLGVIGEQLSGSSSRKKLYHNSSRRLLKGNSLDMRLPKINEHSLHSKDGSANSGSISNVKLPTLGKKYNHGKYFINNPKLVYGKKYSNAGGSNYRYKYARNSINDVYSNNSGKNSETNSSKMLNKLKMYQNGIKIGHKDIDGKRKLTRKTEKGKFLIYSASLYKL
jgi:hypothetical protein